MALCGTPYTELLPKELGSSHIVMNTLEFQVACGITNAMMKSSSSRAYWLPRYERITDMVHDYLGYDPCGCENCLITFSRPSSHAEAYRGMSKLLESVRKDLLPVG